MSRWQLFFQIELRQAFEAIQKNASLKDHSKFKINRRNSAGVLTGKWSVSHQSSKDKDTMRGALTWANSLIAELFKGYKKN